MGISPSIGPAILGFENSTYTAELCMALPGSGYDILFPRIEPVRTCVYKYWLVS